MGYTTLGAVKTNRRFMAATGGCDDQTLTDLVNRIRQEWYLWYEDLPLFLDAVQCFEVQTFCLDCNDCQDSYRGVTLPADFQTVEAMWWNDWPVRLQSSWREFVDGMTPECACGLEKIDVGGNFATELDISPKYPRKIVVMALSPGDAGKKIMVRGVDVFNRPFEQEFALSTQPQQTSVALNSLARPGGIVKDRTEGRVVVSDETGRKLAIYRPEETVPAYRRIKITGLPASKTHVNIRAARRYVELFDPWDVVESDNFPAFEQMARFFRIDSKNEQTESDLRSKGSYLAHARALLVGEVSRETGKSTRFDVTVATPRPHHHTLNRFSRI